ncbi:MAG: magnesium-dependent phosphatase-1 [Thermoproteota archaeon]|nr:MAG: magnesium-dependent phosphatase-1 [Candidatus Korarchaeota archaeon]
MRGPPPEPRLIILDLDRTLWDHEDVSRLSPPFRRVSEWEVVDSSGETVRLRAGAREFLRSVRGLGVLLAVASWNRRDRAEPIMDLLGILEFFDLLVIEFHPRKDEMVEKILGELGVRPEEAVFIDDDPAMIERVGKRFPGIALILFGRDASSFEEIGRLLGVYIEEEADG